ncbi:MAG: hypothetical protein ACRCUQ_05440 [Alphaproteobacteria bacterium]
MMEKKPNRLIERWFTPLGLGLLIMVLLKMAGLYTIYWLCVKDHKVFVTTQTLQGRVFSDEKKGNLP